MHRFALTQAENQVLNPSVFLTGLGFLHQKMYQTLGVTGWKGPQEVIWFNLLLKAGLHFFKTCRTPKAVFKLHAPQRTKAASKTVSPMLETDEGDKSYHLTVENRPHIPSACAAAAKKNQP